MDLDAVLAELKIRNEPVPKPLRLPTVEEVNSAQQHLGVLFHPDYRQFLLEASNVVFGTLEPCTVLPEDRQTYLVNVAEEAWSEAGLPTQLLPICEENGDYYCIDESGAVVYWSHNGTTDERWADLASWIKQVWIGEE